MTIKKYLITSLSIFLMMAIASCSREDVSPTKIPPIEGAVVTPEVGGATQFNQVWVELATNTVKKTHREAWDLGFYGGDEYRVILNSSLVMAAGKINNVTDMNAVNSQTVANLKNLIHANNFGDNSGYIDNPNGQVLVQTSGIAEIKENDSENNVYLLNMGYKTYTGTTSPGSVYTLGDERGWKKIRILRHSQGYKLQYADLDATTFQEFIITKDAAFNYQFFSIINGNYADVQPKKDNWDICFTIFTNLALNPSDNTYTGYVFADSVLHNTLGKVGVYEVVTAAGQGETAYANFKAENVDPSKFITNDQRTIGANWRTTTGPNGAEVYSNKFYILKNSQGFYFKLRFLRMKNDSNERGHPQFEYKAL